MFVESYNYGASDEQPAVRNHSHCWCCLLLLLLLLPLLPLLLISLLLLLLLLLLSYYFCCSSAACYYVVQLPLLLRVILLLYTTTASAAVPVGLLGQKECHKLTAIPTSDIRGGPSCSRGEIVRCVQTYDVCLQAHMAPCRSKAQCSAACPSRRVFCVPVR